MNRYKDYVNEEVIELFSDYKKLVESASTALMHVFDEEEDEKYVTLRKSLVGTATELYGEKTIIEVLYVRHYLNSCPIDVLAKTARGMGISIPKKKERKGNEVWVVKAVLKRWNTVNLTKFKAWVVEKSNKRYEGYRTTFDEWDKDKIAPSLYEYAKPFVEYLTTFAPKDEALTALRMLDLYFMSILYGDKEGTEFIVQHFTPLCNRLYEKEFLEAFNMYLLAEDRERKADFEVKATHLEETLRSSERAADEQIKDALTLIEEKDAEIQRLLLDNERLKQRIKTYEKIVNRETPLESELFENKLVLVIGHPAQRDMYEEEITFRGGVFEFLISDSKRLGMEELDGALSRCDEALYLTSYTSHAIDDRIKSSPHSHKVKNFSAGGRDSFISELERIYNIKRVETPSEVVV